MKSKEIKELHKWLNNLLKEKYINKADIKQILNDFDWGDESNLVEARVSPACERKLIISIENDTVLFDNLNDFKPLEFMGILHNAVSTADVLYKTKVMQMVEKASKSG